jgi:Ca2+-binding EF-hand superfamily protein
MRKTTPLLLAGIAASLAFGSTAALAQQGPGPNSHRAERFGGRDLPSTRGEVEARTEQAFARLDVNGDGQLNADDRNARRTNREERRATRGDAMFDRLDADSNGVLSREEFDSARNNLRERAMERRGQRGENRMRGMGRRGNMGGMMGGQRNLAEADSNGDGSISAAEFSAATLARFDKADSNGDGTISQDERKGTRETMRERIRERRAERKSQPAE